MNLFIVALAAIALATAPPLAAQRLPTDTTRRAAFDTTNGAAADSARRERTPQPLHPVVVTATRSDAPQPTSPVSTTVITGAELRARGIVTLADALATVPGIYAPRSGSYGAQTSLFVRGGQSDYAQVLIDGVPVNDPGGFIDLANLGTDDIERIEVVRGPASVLYGANAVTGVVQIFTRRGRGPVTAEATVDAGTYGARDFSGALRGGEDRAGFSVAAAHHGTRGIYAFNGASRDNVIDAGGRFAPDDRTALRASLRYIDAGVHIPTDYTGAEVDSNQFHLERRWVGSLDGTRRLGSRLTARALLGFTNGATRSAQGPNTPAESCGWSCYDVSTGTYRRSADLRLGVRAASTLVLTGGATTEWQRQHTTGGDAMSRRLHAYYVEAAGSARNALSYTLGARIDDNSAFGTFTTWRAAAGWRLDGGTRLRASAGTAFKEPTFDEVSSTAPYARGNPALRPEHATSWEAGVDQSMGSRASVGATYFHQRFRDMIQYDAQPASDSAPNYYNLAAANANGVEVEARVAPVAALGITARYTHLLTRVVDAGVDSGPGAVFVAGERLIRRPAHQASLAVDVRPSTRGALHATVSYVGSRTDIDYANSARVESPAYTTLDLAGELMLLRGAGASPSLTLTARLANALDARYAPIYGFRAPGRALVTGLRLAW